MGAADDPKTFGQARLSFASSADVDEFVATLEKFEKGELSADQWKAFRLVRGTYGQRQGPELHMLRVKVPQGILDAAQLQALAEVSEAYSRGYGHITTRQNVQFHFVQLHDVEPAMRRLAEAGLTTREACGNSVRNVTACPYAGVAADEAFDVTPYAEAMTRYLLRHPLSASLPRKFKIAFEGCPEDHAVTLINDLGFTAHVQDGRRGFRVTVAGGTATLGTSGRPLFEHVDSAEILEVTEAVVRVFHARGDRAHRQRNRLKFLVRELGWDGFKAAFDEALAAFRERGGAALPFDPQHPPEEAAPPGVRPVAPTVAMTAARVAASVVRGPGLAPPVAPVLAVGAASFAAWEATNVRPQKQEGYVLATARLVLGDLTGAQLRVLAELCSAYADGTVRVTPTQNLVLRWVPKAELRELYRRLAAAGLGPANAETLADVTSCPGAETCRLAVTQSRGLGKLLGEHLAEHTERLALAADASIKISGCPNGCGQHHIASIGFQGSVRRIGARVVPQYFVTVGGGVDGGVMRFGRLAAKIPARRLPEAVDRLIALCAGERAPGQSAAHFFQSVDLSRVKAVLAPLEPLSEGNARPEDFVDLGEMQDFRPEIQEGECAS
jgi:sulfite reductase beta subunit-like hemoprotein